MYAQFGKLENCTVWAIALHIRIQDFFGGSCVLTSAAGLTRKDTLVQGDP